MPRISVQLYSARDFDMTSVLSHIGELGISEVEGFGGLYADPHAMRDSLDANGLHMTTGHFDFAMVRDEPAKAIDIARTLGMTSVIVPHLKENERPRSFAGWQDFGSALAEAGKPILDAGFTYGWHNHDFEFIACDNGAFPIEAIMDASSDIGLEFDLAWVHVAGQDPVAWLERYSGRLLAAHVKDRAPDGECVDEDGWADVGHGVMDWKGITPAMRDAGVELMVMEHDKPADALRFITRSYAATVQF